MGVTDSGLDFRSCMFHDASAGLSGTAAAPSGPANPPSPHRNLALYWRLMDYADSWAGHGTHVASTVAGSMPGSYAGDARLDDFAGLAPGSRIVFADVGCDTDVRVRDQWGFDRVRRVA